MIVQEVDGWYFLLSDAVGKRKHLQVGSQHQQKLNNSITQTSEEDSEKTDSNRIVLSDSSHDNTTEMLTVCTVAFVTNSGIFLPKIYPTRYNSHQR